MAIEIDASQGEGGGQIIRTASALATLLGKAVFFKKIRFKRPKPGLRSQHFTSLKTLQRISHANVMGLSIGSTNLFFHPKKISSVQMNVNIGTAGSIGLLVSQLLPVALLKEIKLRIQGGTDVAFAPPVNYLQEVLFPHLKKMNAKFELSIIQRGYYPKGQGIVSFSSKPARFPLKPIKLTELGNLQFIKVISHSASLPKEVPVNQSTSALKVLKKELGEFDFEERIEFKENLPSVGSGICLFAFFDSNAVIGASALGEKGKSALQVGNEAAQKLLQQLKPKKPCDSFLADQIIPFMALAKGKSEVHCSKLTQHALTNISVTEKFLNVKFEVKGSLNKEAVLSVEGSTFKP